MRHRTELLAPAGSIQSLKAAVNAGADAVYIGGSRFGARAYADNPGEKELVRGIGFAHLHGCRVYLTVNTLFKDSEMDGLGAFLKPYYETGLDAAIVQDLGALKYIRELFPGLPIHASTQMTVTGEDAAVFLKDRGVSRIVAARELSLGEISRIHEKTGIEIESFVHGALCYCYSGQCLFSSMLGGRSGNRGRCAQPCRLPYRLLTPDGRVSGQPSKPYLLSPKDICTVEILPEIIEAGVCSLKIEGRMKRPEYTAGVVRIYRRYLDMYLEHGRSGYHVDKSDYDELLSLYNRGGFSEGYYKRHNGKELISLYTPKHFQDGRQGDGRRREYEGLLKSLGREYLEKDRKEEVYGCFFIGIGKKAHLEVSCRGCKAESSGEKGQAAVSKPVSAQDVERLLRKTGNTPFEFAKLDVDIEGEVFCRLSMIGEMRRRALADLEEALINEGARKAPDKAFGIKEPDREDEGSIGLEVRLLDASLLDTVLSEPSVKSVSLMSEKLDFGRLPHYVQRCHAAGKKCLLVMPYIFRQDARKFFLGRMADILAAGLDGTAAKNIDEAAFLLEHAKGIPVYADHSLYTWNQYARAFWHENGAVGDTAPFELNAVELKKRGCRGSTLVAYGHIPLMVTAGCLKKTTGHCDKKEETLMLEDRYRTQFPVVDCCRFCYNVIYNSVPLSLHGMGKEIAGLEPSGLRLEFTIEDADTARRVIRGFAADYGSAGDSAAEYGVAGEPASRACAVSKGYTRGHFKRGAL